MQNAALTCTVAGGAIVSSICTIAPGTAVVIASINQLSVPLVAQRQGGASGIGVQFLSLDKAVCFDRPPCVHAALWDGAEQRRTSVIACLTNNAVARAARAPVSVSHADAVQTHLTATKALRYAEITSPNDTAALRAARLLVCGATVMDSKAALESEESKEDILQQMLINEGIQDEVDPLQVGLEQAELMSSVAASFAYTNSLMMGNIPAIMSNGINADLLFGFSSDYNIKPIVLRASVPIMPKDALEMAAEFNLGGGEKKSRYHTADVLPAHNAEGSARELAKIRNDVGGYLNINGLDLNGTGTSMSGEVVLNFGEHLLSKCCAFQLNRVFAHSVSNNRNTRLVQTLLEKARRRWQGSCYVPRTPSLELMWFKI